MIDKKTSSALIFSLVFILFFSLYLQTAANQVYTADCGELISSSYVLGIPHATGYGVYCQINRFIAQTLPLGNIAFRMSILSALSGALATAFLFLFLHNLFSVIPAASGAAIFGASYTQWSLSTIQEVYSLHILFLCLILYLARKSSDRQSTRSLYLVSFFSGIAVTHHLLTVFFLPAIGIYMCSTNAQKEPFRRKFRYGMSRILTGVLFFTLGVSSILYLPMRSSVNCSFRWIPCHDWQRFLFHVTGQQFRSIMFNLTLDEFIANIYKYSEKLLIQFPFWILIISIPGWIFLLRWHRKDWLVINTAFVLCSLFFLNYRIIDIEVYYIQSYLSVVVFITAGIESLWRFSRLRHGLFIRWCLAGAVCVYFFGIVIRNYWFNDRSRNHLAYEWGIDAFNCVPPDGLLVTQGWSSPFTFLYLDHVLDYRPDILCVVDYKGIVFQKALTENWDIPIVSTLPFDIPQIDRGAFNILGVVYQFNRGTVNLLQEIPWEKMMRSCVKKSNSIFLDYHSRALRAKIDIVKGYWALETGSLKNAIEHLERAELIAHDNALIYNNLSCFFFRLEKYDEAEKLLRRSLLLDPDLVPAKHNLGNTLMKLERFEEALKAFESIGDSPISLGRQREAMGFLYLMLNDCGKAVSQFHRALAVSPRSRTVRINLGIAYYRCDDFQEALSTFNSLLAEFPGDPEVLLNKANVHVSLKEYLLAESDIRELLSMEGEHREALLTLGSILGSTGRTEEAIATYRKLLENDSRNALILNNLGLIYYQIGDYSSAEETWRRSLDLDPTQDRIRLNLGLLGNHQIVKESLTSDIGSVL